jgi:hypothetical protein
MLTKSQKKKLVEATLKARGYQQCVYADKNGPACVIGQLASSCGVSNKELRSFGRRTVIVLDDSVMKKLNKVADDPLLCDLQFTWDKGLVGGVEPTGEWLSEDEARMAMLFFIEEAA